VLKADLVVLGETRQILAAQTIVMSAAPATSPMLQ
jgi:hypothetical protein